MENFFAGIGPILGIIFGIALWYVVDGREVIRKSKEKRDKERGK